VKIAGRISTIVRLGFALACFGIAWAAGAADVRWYKGNTHTHSLWSDGDEFPEMVADWYKSHGYDFLALTDHDVLMAGERWVQVDSKKSKLSSAAVEKCRQRFGPDWLETRQQGDHRQVKLKTFDEVCAKLAEPGKFLMLQGQEISDKAGDHHVHINAIHIAELVPRLHGRNVADTIANDIAAVNAQANRLGRPILAHVNHPTWVDYDVAPEDLAAAAEVRFFEVCNGGIGKLNDGDATHASADKLWDVANTLRIGKMHAPPLYAVGADDAHIFQKFVPAFMNPGRAWTMVRAAELTAPALIEAMNRGDFYASTGVTLRNIVFDRSQRTLTVEVQEEPGVAYTIEFVGTLQGVDPTGSPAQPGPKSKRPGNLYSPEVGRVFCRCKGTSAVYQWTGRELYVRAVVRSDRPMPNAPAGCLQTAWTQPVGWEKP
jgi:hypothetical protein